MTNRSNRTPSVGPVELAIVVLLVIGTGLGPALAEQPVPQGTAQDPPMVGLGQHEDGFQVVETLYHEDFVEDDGGWSASDSGTWEWGIPVAPPEVPVGGIHMWGTDLLGDPGGRSCSRLTSPPIELPEIAAPGVQTARLSLDVFRDLASRYDGAAVFVLAEDGFTYLLEPGSGYDRSLWRFDPIVCLHGHGYSDTVWSEPAVGADDWRRETFDLSRFMGQEIRVQLVHGAGPDDPLRGVYLDEVAVELGVGSNVGPEDLASPGALLDAMCVRNEMPGWQVQGSGATWCRSVPTDPEGRDPVWATNPHGPHAPGECSYLVTDPVDTSLVPGLGAVRLTISHFIEAAFRSGAQVQVSRDDGESWRSVDPDGSSTRTERNARVIDCLEPGSETVQVIRRSMDSYEEDTFTLRSWDDETIRFRFAFAGMGAQRLGWYLEDVELTRGLVGVSLDSLMALTAAPGGERQESGSDLFDLAGPRLKEILQEDAVDEPLEVVVTGSEHMDVPRFQDRDQALAHFEEQARPFVQRVEAVLQSHGGQVERVWAGAPAVLVTAGVDALEALAGLEESRHFAANEEGSVRLVEPLPAEEGGLGVLNSEGRKLIQAEQAWEEGFTGTGITISVIDTGIDGTHEAFFEADGDSRIVGWLDLVDGEPEPYDDHGHGTHVAGSAAGSSVYVHPEHGAFQEKGVAPDADLLGVKFLNGGGAGDLADALEALEWSFEQGAQITSNSWGSNCEASDSIVSLVRQTGQGMLSVFAAGNSGPSSGTIGGPACGEDSVTVGATDADSVIAGFSSRGPCKDPVRPGAQLRICPDVVAKGENVRSAVPRSGATGADPSGYQTWSGTSMATPHVAGAVALIEQMKIEMTGSGWDTAKGEDKKILEETAEPLPSFDSEPSNDYGHGMVQVMNVFHVLEAGNTAHVLDTFFVEEDVVRIGERMDYAFTVRNFGPVAAEGDYRATLTHPDGTIETLKESQVTLGYLDREGVAEEFTVAGDTQAGEYVFAGAFAYEWVDPESGETIRDEIEHEASFTVVRPFVELTLQGLEEEALPGVPQPVTLTGHSTGNEDADAVEIRFTVPAEYKFVPPGPTSLLGEPEERYAEPPPDRVHEHDDAVTLVWDVGSLGVGDEVRFDMELVGTVPEEYRFIALAAFDDAEENRFAQGLVQHQVVIGPGELVEL